MNPGILVTAKSPVPGQVKTRLAANVGATEAAELAALSLLDTLAACVDAVGPTRRHLALAGDLDEAVLGDELKRALADWQVRPQVGTTFGERLVHAHRQVPGPVLQIGMDTPQVTPDDLEAAAAMLVSNAAVMGPADDGGWWLLGLCDPRMADCLADVPMSDPSTGELTLAALNGRGLRVAETTRLRDVDTSADADAVAALAPQTRFARGWVARS